MAIEKMFVNEGIKEAQIESFLRERFDKAGYSHTEIQRTPLGTRIIVYANKPGLVIGRSGRRVLEITEEIKKKFGFENPLVDVREVENPLLDANIVADRIAKSLERGLHYKRVCNFYLKKVMEAGAVGIQIVAAGKLAGVERSRFQKFMAGFIAHSGDYADKLVDKSNARAMLRPGAVGIKVKIMLESPKEFIMKEEIDKEGEEASVTKETAAEEPKSESKATTDGAPEEVSKETSEKATVPEETATPEETTAETVKEEKVEEK